METISPFIPPESEAQSVQTIQDQPLQNLQNQPILMGSMSNGSTVQTPQIKESAWPMLLGILSLAATGNAGPLLSLMEQKRKTQVFAIADPYRRRALEFATAGNFKDAEETLGQGLSAVGSRAPEYAAFFNEGIAQTRKAASDFKDLKILSGSMKRNLPDWHPSKGVWNEIDELMKGGTFLSMQGAQNLLNQTKAEIQQYEGVTRFVSQFGMAELPQMPTFQGAEVSDMTLNYLAGDKEVQETFGRPLTRNDITVAMRSESGPLRQLLSQKLGEAREYEFKFNVAKNIPLEPGIAEGLLKQGMNPTEVATRDATPSQWANSVDMLFRRQYAQQAATLTARADVNSIQTGIGFTVDVNTGQLDTKTPLSTAIRDPNKAIMPDKEAYGQFKTLHEARNRLSLVLPAMQSLPDTTDYADRVATFVMKELNQRIPLDPKLSGQQALEWMAKDAVERLANALNVKAERFNFLTRPISGTLATKQNAIEVYNRIADFMDTQHQLLVLQNNRKGTEKFLKEVAPTGQRGVPTTGLTPDFSEAK